MVVSNNAKDQDAELSKLLVDQFQIQINFS